MCPYFEMLSKECNRERACSADCLACVNMKMCQSKIYEVCPVYVRSLFEKSDCIAV